MAKTYKVAVNMPLVIRELNLRPGDILRRAELSSDLFAREVLAVTADEYFRLWDALNAEMGDRLLPLEIGERVSLEAFDPAIFAALCSINLNQAAKRLSRYKKLIGPIKLDVREDYKQTRLTFSCLLPRQLPVSMSLTELAFILNFTRRATRAHVHPIRVQVTEMPSARVAYEDFFGVRLHTGPDNSIVFSAADAQRPFLTANAEMWRFFESVLKQRLAEIDQKASFAERVHASLYELLPSGRGSVQEVASTLGLSTRSLQRKLNEEGTSFKVVLNTTREELARHYLSQSSMTAAEIAFLLGFDEPNSFFRAFRKWTGQTPRSLRASTT